MLERQTALHARGTTLDEMEASGLEAETASLYTVTGDRYHERERPGSNGHPLVEAAALEEKRPRSVVNAPKPDNDPAAAAVAGGEEPAVEAEEPSPVQAEDEHLGDGPRRHERQAPPSRLAAAAHERIGAEDERATQ